MEIKQHWSLRQVIFCQVHNSSSSQEERDEASLLGTIASRKPSSPFKGYCAFNSLRLLYCSCNIYGSSTGKRRR
nr:hypothetical protein CFP56_29637 [Quercus suber]